jgi:hypothetical protein
MWIPRKKYEALKDQVYYLQDSQQFLREDVRKLESSFHALLHHLNLTVFKAPERMEIVNTGIKCSTKPRCRRHETSS